MDLRRHERPAHPAGRPFYRTTHDPNDIQHYALSRWLWGIAVIGIVLVVIDTILPTIEMLLASEEMTADSSPKETLSLDLTMTLVSEGP